jgi:hypothetical protein
MESAAHGPSQPAAASGIPDAASVARARKAVLLERLDRLGLMGMELAEDAQKLARATVARDLAALEAAPPEAQAAPMQSNGPALSFARAARVARDCIAMELRINEPANAARSGEARARRISPSGRRRLNGMKDEVRKHVERSIKTNAEPHLVEGLLFDMDERLDEPEVEAEFGTSPIGHLVLGLCEELGVKPEMTRWPDEMLRKSYVAETGREPNLPPLPKGGMAKGLPAEERLDKLPNGVIGTPGVPPAIEVPPMEFPYASQQPRPAPTMPPDSGRGRDPPAAMRRPPGASFAR